METPKQIEGALAQLQNTQACWMVRAGRKRVALDLFLKSSCVSVGWGSLGNLGSVHDRAAVRARVEMGKHNYESRRVGSVTGVLHRLCNTIEVGDAVLSYDSDTRLYHIGLVRSGYVYVPGTEFGHRREVTWCAQVSRDALAESTQKALGPIVTVFQVNADAWREIQAAVGGAAG